MTNWDHVDPLKVVVQLASIQMYCRMILLTVAFILGVVIFR